MKNQIIYFAAFFVGVVTGCTVVSLTISKLRSIQLNNKYGSI